VWEPVGVVGGYEILEHTADVGVRARGATLEECFAQAARGLLSIIGIDRPGPGERVEIELASYDLGALLVDWLSEIIYLHDSRDAVVSGVSVDRVSPTGMSGSVTLAHRGGAEVEGVQVKAVTYHQLEVIQTPDGFIARVYFDV
jgi:SHS2 domain-containing protein